MGLFANVPYAQAPGLGLNAFFVFTVCFTHFDTGICQHCRHFLRLFLDPSCEGSITILFGKGFCLDNYIVVLGIDDILHVIFQITVRCIESGNLSFGQV